MSPELQEEFDAWEYGSAEALALVERLADEKDTDQAVLLRATIKEQE